MRNQAQQKYFDQAFYFLLKEIQCGREFPEALWSTRTAYMLTEKATQDLKDRYDQE